MAGPKRITANPVPQQPSGYAQFGCIINATHVSQLVAAVGLPLQKEVATVSANLDRICTEFILCSEALEAATAGESATWAYETAFRARSLLSCFDRQCDQAGRLLRGPSGFLDGFAYLPSAELQKFASELDRLACRAEAAGQQFALQKGAPRQASIQGLNLVRQLADAYYAAFGQKVGVGGKTGNKRSGPAIRFYGLIGTYLAEAHAPERASDFADTIARLTDANRCADYIRKVRGGEPVRKL